MEIIGNLPDVNDLVGHHVLLKSLQPDLVENLRVAVLAEEHVVFQGGLDVVQLPLEILVVSIQEVLDHCERVWRVLRKRYEVVRLEHSIFKFASVA